MNAEVAEHLQQIYENCKRDLLVYAATLTHDQSLAEDLIHAVFERMLRLERLPLDCRPYLFRAVRNAALDERRREFVREKTQLPLLPPTQTRNADLQREIIDALSRLRAEEREIVVMKVYTGFSFREIAEILGAPLSTVSSAYYRSLEELRPMLLECSNEKD